MIGTRFPSITSEEAISILARELAREKAIVVSGGAIGTDVAAHLAALRVGGETIVIAPQGLGTLPAGWRAPLLDEGRERMLLLSPFGVMQVQTKQTPVVRNRLVAALSEAIVVGEAGLSSGTMHCLNNGREMGVPLFLLEAPKDASGELHRLHKALRRGGARVYTHREASDPALVREILAAARERARVLAEIREAQLDLF